MPGVFGKRGVLAVLLAFAAFMPLASTATDATTGDLSSTSVFDKHERTWKKWFLKTLTDHDHGQKSGVYCATSLDNRIWKIEDAPAFVLSDGEGFASLESFDVARHKTRSGSQYVLVYSLTEIEANSANSAASSIGLALSTDGRHFEKLSADKSPYGVPGLLFRPSARLSNGCTAERSSLFGPRIISANGQLSLWYGELGYDLQKQPVGACVAQASSSDGVTWQRNDDCKLSLHFKSGKANEDELRNTLAKYSLALKESQIF